MAMSVIDLGQMSALSIGEATGLISWCLSSLQIHR